MKKSALLLILFLTLFSYVYVFADKMNIVQNPGFETITSGNVDYWQKDSWKKDSGAAEFRFEGESVHSGLMSATIINNIANDSRLKQEIKVEPNTNYLMSCWVKTDNVGPDNKGANLSIDGLLNTSNDIRGTTADWQRVELYGITGPEQKSLILTIGLGGYGSINTGTAWFDDVEVKKIDSIPAGISIAKLYNETNNTEKASPGINLSQKYFYIALFIAFIIFLYYFLLKNRSSFAVTYEKGLIFAVLSIGFLLRLILAPVIEGYPYDMSCFKAWSSSAAANFTGFYNSGIFIDYPPVYIYVLFIIGKLASIFNITSVDWAYNTLVKLPSITADLVTAYILFKLGKKYLRLEISIFIAALYVFNPTIILNSTVWGQVDSFFTMIIVAAFYMISTEKIHISAIFFMAAFLMKPQGIFFFPILLFELIKRKSFKSFLQSALYSLATLVIVILPFSFSQEPLWIFKLYLKTASQYPYTSLNAFNLPALLGGNFGRLTGASHIVNIGTLGYVLTLLVIAFTGWLYIKSKSASLPYISALIINAGVFLFSARMHERYMFPAAALALLAFIFLKDKRLLLIFTVFSITIFINTYDILVLVLNQVFYIPSKDATLISVSILNIALYIYLIVLSVQTLIYGKFSPLTGGRDSSGTAGIAGTSGPDDNKIFKLVTDKKDFLIMAIMTAVYLSAALINLGGFKVPNTSWQPAKAGESFTIELGKSVNLSRIYYYCGLNDRKYDDAGYKVEYLDKSGSYQPLASFKKDDFYKWKYIEVTAAASRLKFTAEATGGTLNEIAVVKAGSTKPLKGLKPVEKSTDPGDSGTVDNLFDEQSYFEYAPSFMTSTYFDEIYHARTALESLKRLEPYEWTHPPLGKLFIALGILIFGMNPFGFRIIGTLFGAAMIPLMYLFGKKVFNSRVYAFCTAFLMMFDFMHFAQTRIATIDVYGTFFVILMYYFMYDVYMNKSYIIGYKPSLRLLFLSGLFFGIGTACKWIAIYGAAGLALLLFISRYREYYEYLRVSRSKATKPPWIRSFMQLNIIRTALFCVLFFVLIPAIIYFLSYIPYMMVPGPGHGLKNVLSLQKAMLDYHSNLKATHSFSSQWWSWPLNLKPMWFYLGSGLPAGKTSTIASFGNPAVWWAGLVAVPWAIMISVKRKDRKITVIFTALFFQYVPWILVQRLVFIYHFFSSIPFVILAIVYVLQYVREKYIKASDPVYAWLARNSVYMYLAVTAILFIVFYPVISGLPVSQAYINGLKWLKTWIF